MPIYEYACRNCNKEFELLVASSRKDVRCPHCDSLKLTRKFSVFAAHQGAASAESACAAAGCPGARGRGRSSPCAAGRCPLKQ